MALGDITDVDDEPSRDSDDDSSSGRFPMYKELVPYLVIYQDDEGNWGAVQNPQDGEVPPVEFKKPDENKRWERHWTPNCYERHYMDRGEFARQCHIVEETLGEDLIQLIRDDPRGAKRAIIKAAREYNTDRSYSSTERCPVCRDRIHIFKDEYEMIDGRRVHQNHTAKEIAESGFLD